MLMVFLQVIVLTAVIKITPQARPPRPPCLIPLINHLIHLVTTVMTLEVRISLADQKVLMVYLEPKKNPKTQKFSGPTKKHPLSLANVPLISALKATYRFFYQQPAWNRINHRFIQSIVSTTYDGPNC